MVPLLSLTQRYTPPPPPQKCINPKKKTPPNQKNAELENINLEESGIEYDDIVAINRTSNDSTKNEGAKVQAKKRDNVRGKSMPLLRRMRNPSKDKEPLTPEQMGMKEEDAFLTTRKVSPLDLRRHAHVHQRDKLGSNMRRPKDFMRMFDKGQSTEEQPRLDLTYNIEANPLLKKELIAEQILQNLHSRDRRERQFAARILKEQKVDKERVEEMQEDKDAHKDPSFLEKISSTVSADSI